MNNKLDFPKRLMLEVTNVCNNKCAFCASLVSKRNRGMIDSELAKRIIKEAYDLGAREICMHSMGEPLLHKNLAEFVKLAKDLGYEYIYLDTNGILATADVINSVIDAGLDSLKFSVNAASKETYLIVNGTDNFEKVYDNFKNVSEYIKKNNRNVKLIAYMVESSINVHEHDKFEELFKPYATDVWIKPVHNSSGAMTDSNKKLAVENKLAANMCSLDPFNRMVISWEGKAIGCCTDWNEGLVYADVNKESLEDLWNNEKIIALREQLKKISKGESLTEEEINKLNPTCRKCLFS